MPNANNRKGNPVTNPPKATFRVWEKNYVAIRICTCMSVD